MKSKKRSIPKPMQLCRVKGLGDHGYPFSNGDLVLFLGEIVDMPGHCAVVWKGHVRHAYHTDYFVPLSKEEV